MHHRSRARARRIALVLPIALGLAGPASAGGRPADEPDRKVLLHDDQNVLARRTLAHFELADSHGVAYRRELRLVGHPVTLKVHGPVQRKGFGIGFKITF